MTGGAATAFCQAQQRGCRDEDKLISAPGVIPAQARLHGCRAFGELSDSAELTEDRAVVEPRLERRPRNPVVYSIHARMAGMTIRQVSLSLTKTRATLTSPSSSACSRPARGLPEQTGSQARTHEDSATPACAPPPQPLFCAPCNLQPSPSTPTPSSSA